MSLFAFPLACLVRFALCGCCAWLLLVCVRPLAAEEAGPALTANQTTFFEQHVRPLLVAKCYKCHSNEGEHKGDLFLDSKAGWLIGGESGPAIVPGEPDDSLLISAVRYDGFEMPPDKPLEAAEIAILEKWIAMGAPDPRVGKDAAGVNKGIDIAAGRKHWAYQPPQMPAVPTVKNQNWPRGEIDRFLLARLEHEGLAPVGDADRVTLLRRVCFDLTGLPPTPKMIEDFLSDDSPDAYERLVDRQMGSQHFGERWGRHWLDVARFAESVSSNGLFFYEAWRYRDYVIDAFNNDKPYDQFVREQIAGDLLPASSDAQRDEQLIATGFLAMGPYDYDKFDQQTYFDILDEQVDVTTRAFMATTVACARCHDHKFDPIPTTDYYALAGIFASSKIQKTAVHAKGKHTFVRASFGAPLSGFEPEPIETFARVHEDLYADGNAYVRLGWAVGRLKTERETASPERIAAIDAEIAKIEADRAERTRIATAARNHPKIQLPPMALAVVERPEPRNLNVLVRGELDNVGPEVPRGLLQVVTYGSTPTISPSTSGRLQLAEWLARPDHPLTARVMVNRVWLHLFGEGLVATVDNFGINGEAPSHPELLDYLAVRFAHEGWSVKQLIREIMLSRTYQLSVAQDSRANDVDADNRLLWRHHRRRLESEAIRDSILAFSGQLDLTPLEGSQIHDLGPGNLRYQFGQINFDSLHRSIYLPQLRNRGPFLFQLFDHVDNSVPTGRRDVTTVPTQALFMLNSDFIREQAQLAAERLLTYPASTSAARIDHAYRVALGRSATPGEVLVAEQFLTTYAEQLEQSPSETLPAKPPENASKRDRREFFKARAVAVAKAEHRSELSPEVKLWSGLCQVLIASPEFRYVH